MRPQTQAGVFPFFPLLALLFIGLKLGGVIAWSWLWVLAPLWIPLAIVTVVAVVVGIVVFFRH